MLDKFFLSKKYIITSMIILFSLGFTVGTFFGKQSYELKQSKYNTVSKKEPCSTNYEPVCGKKQVQCIKAPCNPILKIYNNLCLLNNDAAKLVKMNECTTPNPTSSSNIPLSNTNTGSTSFCTTSDGYASRVDIETIKGLDIDLDGKVTKIDADIIISYLSDFKDFTKLNGQTIIIDNNKALTYLDSIKTKLDINNDGKIDALTDGIIISRFIANSLGQPEFKVSDFEEFKRSEKQRNYCQMIAYIQIEFNSNSDSIKKYLASNCVSSDGTLLKIDLNTIIGLDVDLDGKVTQIDSKIIVSYLFGFKNFDNLKSKDNIKRNEDILQKLDDLNSSFYMNSDDGTKQSKLDINNDGKSDALTDGIIISRVILNSLGSQKFTLSSFSEGVGKIKSYCEIVGYMQDKFVD